MCLMGNISHCGYPCSVGQESKNGFSFILVAVGPQVWVHHYKRVSVTQSIIRNFELLYGTCVAPSCSLRLRCAPHKSQESDALRLL